MNAAMEIQAAREALTLANAEVSRLHDCYRATDIGKADVAEQLLTASGHAATLTRVLAKLEWAQALASINLPMAA